MQQASQCDPLSSILSKALARGAVVLAPNERAAGDLRARFDQAQAAAGLGAWEAAQVYSWNAWLDSLWSALVTDGAELRLLLNQPQEHSLWREIIAATPDVPSLGSLDSLAELAQNAWRLAASYDALADIRRFPVTHDSRIFAGWAAAFAKRCEQRQYLSGAGLAAALREHVERGSLTPPKNIVLIGFDDDTPVRAALLGAFAAHDSEIVHHAVRCDHEDDRAVVCAASPQEELLTAARWIRRFVKTRVNEATHIALIVPQLQEERAALEATLRNVLAPELQAIDADLSSAPFTFATGTPLADTAMVATALDLMRWMAGPLPLERVSGLLLSSKIGASAEIEARAAFDAFHLRRTAMLRPEIEVVRLHRLASAAPAIAHFLSPLASRAARLAVTEKRSYADWMEFVRDTLRDANWPGDRPLTAQEFRNARTWDHVLDAVATLDFNGPRVDFAAALEALVRLARATSAAHGANDASAQVMTPTEAAGSSFDAVVFLRATDANWPAAERANPLLGWPLQHDLQMPGTDPARSTARAERATARLIDAAVNVLFFYAAEDETGAQRLSPIVERLGWKQLTPDELIANPNNVAPIALDEFEDTAPLPPLFSSEVSGGARVLKQQAACGFLAFAEFRLCSKPIDDIAAGLDALESGNLLHRTMQAFWTEVRSQDALRRMEPVEREALLMRCIAAAVDIAPESDWDGAYLQLQKDRLLILLRYWLNAELDRGPFTVLGLETDTIVSVGPLTLSVRMDRIDRVDGGFVYVDYKTGAAAGTRNWEGERPDDPQLPLYALLSPPGELKGLTFAKVRAGKGMAWAGFQAETGILPMKRPSTIDLDLMIEEWRQNLSILAEDFANGRATVSPKDFAINCSHCAQRLLCRVNPETLLITIEDEAGEDAE